MRRISFLICISLIVLSFSGCEYKSPAETKNTDKDLVQENTEPTYAPLPTMPSMPDEVIFENEHYRILRINQKCYILIDHSGSGNFVEQSQKLEEDINNNSVDRPDEGDRALCVTLSNYKFLPHFKTADELSDKIIAVGMDHDELLTKSSNKDCGVYWKTEICDFERLYVPVLPPEYSVSSVAWGGGRWYQYTFDGEKDGFVASYLKIDSPNEEDCLKKRLAQMPEETYEKSERPDVQFFGKKFAEDHYQYAKYEFTKSGTTYTVFETYYKVDKRPAQFDIYWSIGETDFKYEICTVPSLLEEDLDAEWLKQFTIDIYVREE